ncbi:hypothetical protein HHL16_16280 [Pseudoflavitalea sp. G-6-1-2]|uniref:hypothetical protein n=1 Tax=Pseudoflavitalea sp. G-6-1-2 TaxID=2728841 RepID=UPI00146CD9AE|nr:hypothetical protein [Pseudoflavitalea sp. G-6-1-2]NML22443.1 hypothetical protein [Pseudoflavitalea sp. G-6-1-2]
MENNEHFKRIEELGYTVVVYPDSLKIFDGPMFPKEHAEVEEMLSKVIYWPPELRRDKP